MAVGKRRKRRSGRRRGGRDAGRREDVRPGPRGSAPGCGRVGQEGHGQEGSRRQEGERRQGGARRREGERRRGSGRGEAGAVRREGQARQEGELCQEDAQRQEGGSRQEGARRQEDGSRQEGARRQEGDARQEGRCRQEGARSQEAGCRAPEGHRRGVGLPARTVDPHPRGESRTALVRRARRIDRELAEVYPYAHPELDFENPFQLVVATVLSAQTTDLRVNQTTPDCSRGTPPRGPGRRQPGGGGGDPPPHRLLPRQDQVGHRAVEGARGAVRRGGSGSPRGPGQAARRGPQDRVRRARQRLRAPRDHRRHPLPAPGAPLALDRGDRPRQDRGGGRRAVPKSDWTDLSHHVIWHGRRICHARKPACGACPIAPSARPTARARRIRRRRASC